MSPVNPMPEKGPKDKATYGSRRGSERSVAMTEKGTSGIGGVGEGPIPSASHDTWSHRVEGIGRWMLTRKNRKNKKKDEPQNRGDNGGPSRCGNPIRCERSGLALRYASPRVALGHGHCRLRRGRECEVHLWWEIRSLKLPLRKGAHPWLSNAPKRPDRPIWEQRTCGPEALSKAI